jgi:hypothetical protein
MAIIMKQRKMKWKCPNCPQTSATRWNMEVHIKRKHVGHGLPRSIDHDGSPLQQQLYTDFKHYSRSDNIFVNEDVSEILWPFSRDDKGPQRKDWLDDLAKYMRSMQDLISLSSYSLSALYNRTQPTQPPIFPRYFHHDIGNNTFLSEIGLQKENFDAIIGFSAKVCKLCLTITIDPTILQNGKDLIKSQHSCSPDRLNKIQLLTADQMNKLAADAEQNIPESLLRRCKEWTIDGAYLQVYPTDQVYVSSTMIDIDKLNKESWIVRAINETTILLKDFELSEFLVKARNQTAASICLYSSKAKEICYYLFVIKRKPLPV